VYAYENLISYSLLLSLSVNCLTFASDDSSEEEKRPNVQAMIKAFGSTIPMPLPSPETSPPPKSTTSDPSTDSAKGKGKISLSLSFKKKDIIGDKPQSARSESPKNKILSRKVHQVQQRYDQEDSAILRLLQILIL